MPPSMIERLKALIPPVTVPAGVQQVLGSEAAQGGLLFYGVVERQTTSPFRPHKKVLLIISYTSVFFCDISSGRVLRMIRMRELESPVTFNNTGYGSVVLRVAGENDALLHFIDCTKQGDLSCLEVSTVDNFISKLVTLHKVFCPGNNLEVKKVNVDEAALKAASVIKKKKGQLSTVDKIVELKSKVDDAKKKERGKEKENDEVARRAAAEEEEEEESKKRLAAEEQRRREEEEQKLAAASAPVEDDEDEVGVEQEGTNCNNKNSNYCCPSVAPSAAPDESTDFLGGDGGATPTERAQHGEGDVEPRPAFAPPPAAAAAATTASSTAAPGAPGAAAAMAAAAVQGEGEGEGASCGALDPVLATTQVALRKRLDELAQQHETLAGRKRSLAAERTTLDSTTALYARIADDLKVKVVQARVASQTGLLRDALEEQQRRIAAARERQAALRVAIAREQKALAVIDAESEKLRDEARELEEGSDDASAAESSGAGGAVADEEDHERAALEDSIAGLRKELTTAREAAAAAAAAHCGDLKKALRDAAAELARLRAAAEDARGAAGRIRAEAAAPLEAAFEKELADLTTAAALAAQERTEREWQEQQQRTMTREKGGEAEMPAQEEEEVEESALARTVRKQVASVAQALERNATEETNNAVLRARFDTVAARHEELRDHSERISGQLAQLRAQLADEKGAQQSILQDELQAAEGKFAHALLQQQDELERLSREVSAMQRTLEEASRVVRSASAATTTTTATAAATVAASGIHSSSFGLELRSEVSPFR